MFEEQLATLGPTRRPRARGRAVQGRPRIAPSAFIDDTGASWPSVDGPRRRDRDGVPDRRAAADLLHRRGRDPAGHPDRRGPAGGLRRRSTPRSRRDRRGARGPSSAWRLRKAYAGRRRSWRACRSRSRAASCSRCSARTVRARRRRSRSWRATGAPMPARCGCWAWTRRATARALRPRIGLMLQEGGVDPRSTPREVLRLHARLFRDPEDPDALLEAAASSRAAAHQVPAPVGRRAAAAGPGAGPARTPGAARPRRADRGHGSRGEAGDARADRGPPRRRDHDPAHDPRAGRRRAARRPRGRPRPRAGRRRRARPPSSPGPGRRASGSGSSRRSTRPRPAALVAAVAPGAAARLDGVAGRRTSLRASRARRTRASSRRSPRGARSAGCCSPSCASARRASRSGTSSSSADGEAAGSALTRTRRVSSPSRAADGRRLARAPSSWPRDGRGARVPTSSASRCAAARACWSSS